jgi:hypothetical protein
MLSSSSCCSSHLQLMLTRCRGTAAQGTTIHNALCVLVQSTYRLHPSSLRELATTPVPGTTLLQCLAALLPLQKLSPPTAFEWCKVVCNLFFAAEPGLHPAAEAAGLGPQCLQPTLDWLKAALAAAEAAEARSRDGGATEGTTAGTGGGSSGQAEAAGKAGWMVFNTARAVPEPQPLAVHGVLQ